jgi:hypothetical protein
MPNVSKHGELRRVSVQQELAYPHKPDPSALAKLLDEWMREDDADQRETFELLRRALDEDRPEGYRLFS